MKRSEIRENMFKLVFCGDFHSSEELTDQMNSYIEEMPELTEDEHTYFVNKFEDICKNIADIDAKINSVAQGSSETRKADAKKRRSVVISKGVAQTAEAPAPRKEKGWTTDRMAKADLAILRLAVYEMFYEEAIPVKVAINEAVELAKNFGGDESPAFVNGVLAKLV